MITLIILLYAVFSLILFLGIIKSPKTYPDFKPYITVIVAMRNEKITIKECLNAIMKQDYPNFEVILIDDHSRDNSLQLATDLKHHKLTIVKTAHSIALKGKKAALQTGIDLAQGDWLVFTDADCFPHPQWLSTMAKYMKNRNFLVGISPHILHNFAEKVREVERSSIDAVAAGFLGHELGVTCVGRNIAYQKHFFREIGGFTKISQYLSGDDDLFILQATQSNLAQFAFVYEKTAQVQTVSPPDLNDIYQQERRRSSKYTAYPAWLFAIISPAIFIYTAIIVCFFLAIMGINSWNNFLLLMLSKLLADLLILLPFWIKTKQLWLLKYWIIAELIHIPYSTYFLILSLFPNFKWKDRVHK